MRKRTIILVFMILALLFIGSFWLYQKKSEIYGELNALYLIPRPEQFTELYFQNASALPQAIIADQPVSFAFTVHNVEGVTMTYPYEVYFEDLNNKKTDLADDLFTLANGASTTISISHIFPTSGLSGEFVVDLPSLSNQSIDFLVPDNN